MSKPLNVVMFYADQEKEWNCSQHLIQEPRDALNRAGHNAQSFPLSSFLSQTFQAHVACRESDIIIIERNILGTIPNEILNWQAKGKPVVVRFDDYYQGLPTTHVIYRHWHEGYIHDEAGNLQVVSMKPVDQLRIGMRLVDAALLTSPALVQAWQAYAPCYLVPNYLNPARYKGAEKKPHEGLWIGWGGSVSHFETIQNCGVVPGIKRVMSVHPEAKLIVQTSDPRIEKLFHIPAEQKVYQEWVPYEQWKDSLQQFDISLATVYDYYDTHRSLLHISEPLMLDSPVPVIASNAEPYAGYGQYAHLVPNTAQGWERGILQAVEHLDEYRQQAKEVGQPWAESLSIDKNIDHWVNTLTEIIERKKAQDGA